MISDWLYFMVKVACAVYMMWRLWNIVVLNRMFGFWDWLFRGWQRPESTGQAISDADAEESVLGRTNFVYLEDATMAVVVPERSEELPRADSIQEEADIDADEVENTLLTDATALPPSEDELYDEEHETVPLDTEFSRGMTYDEISNAVGVLTTSASDVDNTLAAARTIFNLKNTDLFDFFTTQVSNAATVENLLADCLDIDGRPLPNRKSSSDNVTDFQWGRYV